MKDTILDQRLERCRPWIEKSLRYSNRTHTFEDICDGVYEGRMQLWAGEHACLVSEILQFPQRRVGNAFLAGGDNGKGLAQLFDMADDMTDWARSQGCDGLMLTGRRGWSRRLPDWTERWTVLTKDI